MDSTVFSEKHKHKDTIMTTQRVEKFLNVIQKKQKTLTVIMENVDDPHNISAVLRSCDAVGIIEVYIVRYDTDVKRMGKKSSASASKWLNIHQFDNLEDCVKAVRQKYDKILTTHLSAEAVSIHKVDFTESVALVFGNEREGVSQEALDLADGNFIIPQYGLIQSLNISVACAVTLYEVLRQRTLANMYEVPQLSETEQQALLEDWKRR